MNFIFSAFIEAWRLLLEASVYILFGLLVGGLLKVFLSPHAVARHLGQNRFSSVFKAALLGIPIPLCSCGVLPAALSLKKQGANNGATTAFLISTPESGVDSIAITYALLDPIMTVARPIVAFFTAAIAGIAENFANFEGSQKPLSPDLACPVDGCCDGIECPPEVHQKHHSFGEKLGTGIKFALTDFWEDLAGWFFIGLIIAGTITALLPDDIFNRYLGAGLPAMLIMLAIAIPLYICATASTPIAAALILKGVSPGAALVFLLAGPATNAVAVTFVARYLGKAATAVYLGSVAVSALPSFPTTVSTSGSDVMTMSCVRITSRTCVSEAPGSSTGMKSRSPSFRGGMNSPGIVVERSMLAASMRAAAMMTGRRRLIDHAITGR